MSKRKKYKQSKNLVLKWCDTLDQYVPEIFCRRSKDAKLIAKFMNDEVEKKEIRI